MKYIISTLAVSVLILSSNAFAGTVKLESSVFDNICKVQVTTGLENNPKSKLLDTYENVAKGFTVSGSDRLCYRRSKEPNNCQSQYTVWTCKKVKGSGTGTLKLS
ncbi:hypothetical protein [Marinicella rhabdoformis]|uniref:hypothetical protein n=1 Tax=Marinicella rhabdoformis TaxID=2580566 RepID=UPI0012AEDB66|nr:hypothetical protein [Marinicella rhabdoformis]